MTLYQSDVAALSDAALQSLHSEIEDAGLLGEGSEHYEEGSWQRQACDRYWELEREIDRRWELAHPEEAAEQRKYAGRVATIMNAQIEAIKPRISELFEHNDQICRLIRRAG